MLNSPENIATLITTAFEGGSIGWLSDVDVIGRDVFQYDAPWYSDPKFWEGDYDVQMNTIEDGTIERHITPETIADGLAELGDDFDMDNHDAEDADRFLQAVAFKEVVYG
jgi:hypothetical protein